MPAPSPASVRVIAVLSIIFGILGLVCGGLRLGTQALTGILIKSPPQGGTTNIPAEVLTQLTHILPTYQIVETTLGGLILLLSLILIVAAVGLLSRHNWARWLALLYVLGAIFVHVSWAAYELGVVMPALQQAQRMVANRHGLVVESQGEASRELGRVIGILLASGLAVLHALILGVIVLLPDVAASFNRRHRPRDEYDDYDEDYDEDDDYEDRRSRRRRDHWDD